MEVALLNIRIQFQKNTIVVDEIGNRKSEWATFYSCYATVSGEGGSEKSAAGLIAEDSDLSFTVRYCNLLSGITTTECRILFQGDVYDVVGIDHFSYKKKILKFRCKKVRW
ncbi:MAG: phage head closure protein [Suipraeoptans sp.]